LVGWRILLFLVVWLIFPFLISWLILHFLVKFVIILFMDGQFYFATLGRYLSTCQFFILSITSQSNISFSILDLCDLEYVFSIFVGFLSLEFLSHVLVFYTNLLFIHGPLSPKSHF
jgi:hypothetical protein